MDPVSAVGIAAGAVQFADLGARALLEMVKTLQALKHTPKRMADLLEDVEKSIERIYHLREAAQQPNSPLFSHLSLDQTHSLRKLTGTAYDATEDLQNALERTLGHHVNGLGRKAWRSIVTVAAEKNITEKVNRIIRLNIDVMSHLQFCGLDMQARHWELSAQMRTSVEASRSENAAQLNATMQTLQRIIQNTDVSNHHLMQLQPDMKTIKDSLGQIDVNTAKLATNLNNGEHGKQLPHGKIEVARDNILAENRRDFQSLLATVQQEADATRDLIHKLAAGQHIGITTSQSTSNRSSFEDAAGNIRLATNLRRRLIESPSTFRDTYQRLNRVDWKSLDFARQLHLELRCHCPKSSQHSFVRRGPFGFRYDSRADHVYYCEFGLSHPRYWSYTAFVQLVPFMNKTIELAFSATSGSGGRAIGPSLRFRGIVQRSGSAAFQLLDGLVGQFTASGIPMGIMTDGYFIGPHRGSEIFRTELDVQGAKAELNKVRRDLAKLFVAGSASAYDTDEFGNTLLHIVFTMIVFLHWDSGNLMNDLFRLARFIIAAGADIHATSEKVIIKSTLGQYHEVLYNILDMDHKLGTISEMAFEVLIAQPHVSIPLFDLVDEHLMDQSSAFAQRTNATMRWISSSIRFFQRLPQSIEFYGYGALEQCLLQRSDDGLIEILPRFRHLLDNQEYNAPSPPHPPMNFAIGWPDGLRKMLDAGFDPNQTLHLAIHLKDLSTIHIILQSDSFPRHDCDWYILLRNHVAYSTLEVQTFIMKELAHRRNALAVLARECIPWDLHIQPRISVKWTLDVGATELYRALVESGVRVPNKLNPAMNDMSKSIVEPIYNCFQCLYQLNEGFLDVIFEHGFDVGGNAVLLRVCQDFCKRLYEHRLLLLIRWFLDRETSPQFSSDEAFPNILFYLATRFSIKGNRSSPLSDDFYFIVQRSASLCDPLSPDGCVCFCSSIGCLPIFKFWTCEALPPYVLHLSCRSTTFDGLQAILDKWLNLCNGSPEQYEIAYEAICRLEIFHRLGMIHTCCASYQNHDHIIRHPMDENDLQEVQKEDAELKSQLDLFMQAYQTLRLKHPGTIHYFWNIWWLRVDSILPGFEPRERCRVRCGLFWKYDYEEKKHKLWPRFEDLIQSLRCRKERRALDEAGYHGMDFRDIIRLHFSDVLLSDPCISASSLPDGVGGIGEDLEIYDSSDVDIVDMATDLNDFVGMDNEQFLQYCFARGMCDSEIIARFREIYSDESKQYRW